MKNDSRKKLVVVVLDEPGVKRETRDHGSVGFRVKGRQLTLYWADKGRTWLPAEDVR